MSTPTPSIERHARLTPEEVQAVFGLIDDVTEADGVPPLSEHVMLHLRYGGDQPARNLLMWTDGKLAAYAHLDVTDLVAGPSAELAVAPSYRRRGYGTRLVEAALADSADGRLRLWSHGRSLAAAALAYRFGFRSERVLWQMRRSLYAPIPAPQLPAGVAVRTFVVDQDEAAWTEVNNRAFADHPDQGHWSVTEVQKREQEPWFDPSGFFLAERGDRLVGFHWTKIHGGDHDAWRLGDGSHGHEPIGEVYVVGVDPAEQGNGLGPALTLIGLRYLRSRGLSAAMLYVDETNRRAIKLYESVGFTRWDIDVGYQRG